MGNLFRRQKGLSPPTQVRPEALPRAFRVRGPGAFEWLAGAKVSLGGLDVPARVTNRDGHVEFQIPVQPLGQTYSVFVDATGYRRLELHGAFAIDGQVRQDPATILILAPLVVAPPTPTVEPAERLRVHGVNFVKPDGSIWKWRGVTGFTGLEDWLAGRKDKLTTYAAWMRAQKRNTWRVFGMWSRTGFDPRDHSHYYSGLDSFLRWLASEGLYLHYTAFCDQVDRTGPAPGFTKNVILSSSEQNAHFRKSIDVCRANPNVFFEDVNEDFKNGALAARFFRDDHRGVISTRSSWEDGQAPDTPGSVLDFTSEHTPRDGEWERKAKNLAETSRLGVGSFPATKKPAVSGEPMRVAEATTPRQWADYAAVGEMFGAGITIHGGDAQVGHASNLQRCIVPTGAALACCEAVKAVIDSGAIRPETAGVGLYTAGHLGNSVCDDAGALKSYAMIEGDRATLVRVRETTEAVMKNGWRVVSRKGPNQQIYLLEQ